MSVGVSISQKRQTSKQMIIRASTNSQIYIIFWIFYHLFFRISLWYLMKGFMIIQWMDESKTRPTLAKHVFSLFISLMESRESFSFKSPPSAIGLFIDDGIIIIIIIIIMYFSSFDSDHLLLTKRFARK